MNRWRAVTLLELLVVLGIIAILVAISMPVIHRARREAVITRSMSNMKQIHAAMVLYCNDFKCEELEGVELFPWAPVVASHSKLPREILKPGGPGWLKGRGSAYVHLAPFWETASAQNYKEYRDHILRSGGNPIVFVDPTHNETSDEPSSHKPIFVLTAMYDGSVVRRQLYGNPQHLPNYDKFFSGGQ